MKFLFLSLLLMTQLFAYKDALIKAHSYLNNYSIVKLVIRSPMLDEAEAKLKKTNSNYITNVKVKADDKLIYHQETSPCLSENPLFKFSYSNIKPISLTLDYTDNNGIIKIKDKKVKYKNTIKEIPKHTKLASQYLELSPNAKTYPNKIKSIKNLFGDIILIEDGIQLTAPKLAENGGSIPLNIRSNIKFKSIALFIRSDIWKDDYDSDLTNIPCGEENKFSLVSQWFSTPYSIVNFSLRVTMTLGEGEVLVVLEAENGKFYTVKKYIDVSVGGLNVGG